MKPRIAIFGLPPLSSGEISIWIYKNPIANHNGDEVFNSKNNEAGVIFEYAHSEIELGDVITIVMISSGICEYSHRMTYKGTDISHVPSFQKEDTSDSVVSQDWILGAWKNWRPEESNRIGLETEKSYILSRKISVAPIWESYYAESKVDYLEKFHKLWIGLNSYASQFSNETGDKNKILALVNSNLRTEFNSKLNNLTNLPSEQKWRTLMQGTGVNMTSEIVRDEINKSNSCIDFLELAKNASGLFSDVSAQLDGLVFLDKGNGKNVFQDIFSQYHQYMASAQGIVETFVLANAFQPTKSPESTIRIGRLVYHNPFESNTPGTLFNLESYFGLDYSNAPYAGQNQQKLKDWEMIDPLFFKYLFVLYKFRCAYFHGDLSPNKQNDELAKSAYHSLYEIFASII
jgi:hypothetical protein